MAVSRIHQRLVEKVLYPLLARYHGSRELHVMHSLIRSERFSAEELHLLRLDRLRAILRHAEYYVPFYKRRFAAVGFNIKDFKDFGDLQQLPILTKADIQQHRDELISSYYERKDIVENRTGGSTGSPLVFYHNKERLDSRQGATLRHNLWAGYRIGCKAAVIWGHQSDLSLFTSTKARVRKRLIDRTLIVDAASFSEESLHAFIRRYKSFKPDVILSYANSLAALVEYCIEQKVELPSPQSIITSAEVLTPENRELIESYFRAPIFDRYGCREVSIIASECEAHEGLHINAENLYLEFINDHGQVPPGEMGRVIVTDLGNYAFPFIRYEIGDLGSPAAGACSCGRVLPLMKMVAGRTSDFLVATDGRRVSGTALTILLAAKVPGVRQVQIIQKELHQLVFRLVTDPSFGPNSENLIRKQVAHFFGGEMGFSLEFVKEIPKEASGKYRFSICEI
jgi:phenylacetate-CoA ligase